MFRIGIDLGGTNIAVGLVNEFCKIIVKKSTPTLASRPSDEITADIARLCFEVCAEAKTPITEIESIGIAAPGIANLDNGCVEYSCNLPFLRYPIVKKLASMLDVDESKIKIANDANAAAYGEAVAGAARGSSNSIMVTLGTGVGGGIIINGEMLSGATGAGGEIGHIHIQDGEPDACGCGNHGCLEQYASATGIVRLANRKLDATKEDSVLRYKNISAKSVFDAVKAGDKVAIEIAEEFGAYLGKGLAAIAGVVNPEAFVIGGGVSKAGEILFTYIEENYKKNVFHGSRSAKFELATLGNDAGICGAAKLILE